MPLGLNRVELDEIYAALQLAVIQVHHGRSARDLQRVARLDHILDIVQQVRREARSIDSMERPVVTLSVRLPELDR